MEVANVKKPPLEMVDHFFTKMMIKAKTPELSELESEKPFGFETKCDVETKVNEKDETLYQVLLGIKSLPKEGFLYGYEIDVEVIGIFRPSPNYSGENITSMIEMIGASLLYGAAREFIYTVTTRGPWPAMYLETTSFIPDTE